MVQGVGDGEPVDGGISTLQCGIVRLVRLLKCASCTTARLKYEECIVSST